MDEIMKGAKIIIIQKVSEASANGWNYERGQIIIIQKVREASPNGWNYERGQNNTHPKSKWS